MKTIKWEKPCNTSLPSQISNEKTLYLESNKSWDIYISNFTKENKLYEQSMEKDIILIYGYVNYKLIDRLVPFTLYKNRGLKFHSVNGYNLQSNKFPKYLINKINSIINEIEYK